MSLIRSLAQGARYITSFCTGSLILGAPGLLEGKGAACHWAWREFSCSSVRSLTPDPLSGTVTSSSPAAALLPVPLHPAGRMSILTAFPARRPDELRKMGSHPAKKRNTSLLVKGFMPTKKIQVNLREPLRIMANNDGRVITSGITQSL
jgi:hypothetical protein